MSMYTAEDEAFLSRVAMLGLLSVMVRATQLACEQFALNGGEDRCPTACLAVATTVSGRPRQEGHGPVVGWKPCHIGHRECHGRRAGDLSDDDIAGIHAALCHPSVGAMVDYLWAQGYQDVSRERVRAVVGEPRLCHATPRLVTIGGAGIATIDEAYRGGILNHHLADEVGVVHSITSRPFDCDTRGASVACADPALPP